MFHRGELGLDAGVHQLVADADDQTADDAVVNVLLDDRGYVALLKLYLARAGYLSGSLFRASINGRGGPLSYDAAHSRWKKYSAGNVIAEGTSITYRASGSLTVKQ